MSEKFMYLHSGPQTRAIIVYLHCIFKIHKYLKNWQRVFLNYIQHGVTKWLYFCPIICPTTGFYIIVNLKKTCLPLQVTQ